MNVMPEMLCLPSPRLRKGVTMESIVAETGQSVLSHPARILLVEDDAETSAEIAEDLTERGYSVVGATNGLEALDAARKGSYDLLIMDRSLPGMDGLSIIARLRDESIRVPVLVLSALAAVDERVAGLKAGGDDYMTKPFALTELAARIEALLRRPAETRQTVLHVGPLVLDLIERTAARAGRGIELLPREFKLLEYMMRRADQIITREMVLQDVWHYRFLPQTNLVDVHVGNLRRKVDAPGEAPMFRRVRGSGFMLVSTPDTLVPSES